MINLFFEKRRYKVIVNQSFNKSYLIDYINKLNLDFKLNINYNFISKKEQIKLNIEYKNHNYNTDILTFPLLKTDCELTSDVYISLKQIKKNAKKYNETLFIELNRVMIHGLLHLIGYNDESNQEKIIMRQQENKYLKFIKLKFHGEHI